MRTKQYRYTEWGRNGSRGAELYDYDTDPDETINIANLPEKRRTCLPISANNFTPVGKQRCPMYQNKSLFHKTLPWDINNDGIVDIGDMIFGFKQLLA